MHNDIGIDFLAIIDECAGEDTEVNMTKFVAMRSPHYHGRLHRRVHSLKLNSPGIDERLDAPLYFRRSCMQHLS